VGISEQIELRHLRAFVAVAEELNFRAAAERMHLTQPPLSRTIGQLEGILGVRLFRRNTRGCELTDSGVQLLPCARRVMSVIQDELPLLRHGRRSAVLRLGVCFALDAVKLPGLRETIQHRTGLSVDFEMRRSHELARMLAQGELDLAIVLLPIEADLFRSARLATAEMMAALPASHALARQRAIAVSSLSAFDRFIFVSRKENAPLFNYFHGELTKRGLRAPRYVQSREAFEGFAQVAAGVACSLLCETLQGFTGKDVVLRRLRKQDRITVDFGLIGKDSPDQQDLFVDVEQSVREFLVRALGLHQ
jgi:DNA-binding transcriptional LysR family regulator